MGKLLDKTIGEYCIDTEEPIKVSFYNGNNQLTHQIKSVYKEEKIDSLYCIDCSNNLLISRKFNYLNNGDIDFIRTKDFRMIKSSLSDVIESFDYDKKGRLVLSKQLTVDGRLISFWEHRYNGANDLESSIYYPTLDFANFTKVEISYEPGKKLMGITYYNKDNTVSQREIFIRDFKGVIHDYTVYQLEQGKLLPDFIQSFDSNGLEERRVFYDTFKGIGEAIGIEYTFDSKNNWIEKVEKDSRGIQRIYIREITYAD